MVAIVNRGLLYARTYASLISLGAITAGSRELRIRRLAAEWSAPGSADRESLDASRFLHSHGRAQINRAIVAGGIIQQPLLRRAAGGDEKPRVTRARFSRHDNGVAINKSDLLNGPLYCLEK